MSSRRGHGEGSIYKRADGRWAATIDLGWVDGRRKRKYIYGKTRREVTDNMRRAFRSLDGGATLGDERKTVDAFLDDWLSAVRPRVRYSTWRRYEELLRVHARPSFGKVVLNRLGPQHLQATYGRMIASGRSPTTVGQLHRVLHAAFRQAIRWDLVVRNAAELVDPPRIRRNDMVTLSADQVRSMLRAASGDPLEALYVLAVTTGMRQGELLGLRWSDVDLEARAIRVQSSLQWTAGHRQVGETKTSSSRRQILLTQPAVAALRAHRRAQNERRLALGADWTELDLIFPNFHGRPLNPSNLLNRHFRPLLERADLPRIRFHDLRHTAATLLLGAGVHPKIVSEMLGHAQVGVTLNLYSHVTPTMQREAIDALDALLAVNLAVGEGAAQL